MHRHRSLIPAYQPHQQGAGRREEEGFDATGAASAEDALGRITEARPDVILSDIRMPDLDGIESLAISRSEPRIRRLQGL